jgi:hypothetical protein
MSLLIEVFGLTEATSNCRGAVVLGLSEDGSYQEDIDHPHEMSPFDGRGTELLG